MVVGRNELCPCGSGKKYKKCCLDRENDVPSRRNDSIQDAAIRLKGIFEQYNLNDILSALFAIAAWLPNVSSSVKIELLYKVALSIHEDRFLGVQTIDTYPKFVEFFSKIKCEIPNFSMMEDFTPASEKPLFLRILFRREYVINW